MFEIVWVILSSLSSQRFFFFPFFWLLVLLFIIPQAVADPSSILPKPALSHFGSAGSDGYQSRGCNHPFFPPPLVCPLPFPVNCATVLERAVTQKLPPFPLESISAPDAITFPCGPFFPPLSVMLSVPQARPSPVNGTCRFFFP